MPLHSKADVKENLNDAIYGSADVSKVMPSDSTCGGACWRCGRQYRGARRG